MENNTNTAEAAATAESVLKMENVSMGYLAGQEVLHDISLTISRGGFYFLSGASGAGKSSLLNLMALAVRPLRGNISLFGTETTVLSHQELPPMRRRIGTVFQDYRLIDHLTVEENVGLPLKIAGDSKKEVSAKVTELLSWVGLNGYHRAKPGVLSGGQKQRVAIARAVISAPDILLADEPSGNLDPTLRMKFMYLFETLHKGGTTIVFATHDDNLISAFKHPVITLRDGRLAKQ